MYTDAKTQYNVTELDIWNMDETGYTIGFAYSAKVVILQGNITNFKTVDGSREWVLQINSISIYSQIIPPFFVFKGHQYTESLWQEAVEAVGDCTIGISENGWSNQQLGMA
jgi:hypothetical protein